MTSGLKWRMLTLQIVLAVALAFGSGFLFWASSFTQGYVHDELSAQKISFPAADSKSIAALPAANATAMKQYAGQALDNGDKAKVYANNFIAIHLDEIGMTYSQASAKAMANPTDTKLAATVQTLFRGETLRGLLLNAYAFGKMGTIALTAAIVSFITAGVMLLLSALGFWHLRRVSPEAEVLAKLGARTPAPVEL